MAKPKVSRNKDVNEISHEYYGKFLRYTKNALLTILLVLCVSLAFLLYSQHKTRCENLLNPKAPDISSSFTMIRGHDKKFTSPLFLANVNVAHKFGEHSVDQSSEFSESGIVYRNKEPYLITIMTRGNSIKDQTQMISDLSSMVYKNFQQQ